MKKSLRIILQELYLDFINNYITIDRFAEHKEISRECAKILLKEGREIHEFNVSLNKK